MPYVKQELRNRVDVEIDKLIYSFRNEIGWGDTGSANYTITRTILGCMKPDNGWTYDSLSDVIKTLECSKLEIARRLLDRHECGAINRNGDLDEFA
jgi:hypothetical protein